jgi:hypothetical protein
MESAAPNANKAYPALWFQRRNPERVSCPGRGAAFFTMHRRAGTQACGTEPWAPDQQRTARALRSVRGTLNPIRGLVRTIPE